MKKIVLSLAVASSLLVVNSFADLNDGLVAHYEFEDNANDSSGNGNNGIENGNISYAEGKIGKSIYFNGNDSSISGDASAYPSGAKSWPASVHHIQPAWIKDNHGDCIQLVIYRTHCQQKSGQAVLGDWKKQKWSEGVQNSSHWSS
jgi:hypothetical protein